MDSPIRKILQRSIVQQTLRDSGYVLATLPLAIASFVVIVTGISLAAGLAIIWIGLPVGLATLYAARSFAIIERRRLRAQGTIIEKIESPRRQGSYWSRMLRTLIDPGLWREALHGILILPINCITWSVALTWWALVVGGLSGWIWEPIPGSGGANQLMKLLHWPISGIVFDLIVGILALITLPAVVRACSAAQIGLARALLSPTRASLERRVTELAEARDQLGKAETSALRRMERDLHDGPQQTLIRLGMDLAASERRLSEGDIDSTTELISGARAMTESVIADLRALSRNIAPPILTERGLGAAIQAAAATCPIPVLVAYELNREPSEVSATAAYFVTCEALANAVKHSAASQISVYFGADDNDNLCLEIRDNGKGGAVVVPGHGLAGLRDRVKALDGRLSVGSEPGTTIAVVLPM